MCQPGGNSYRAEGPSCPAQRLSIWKALRRDRWILGSRVSRPQSTETNNTCSRPLRRSWNLHKCDDQHLSERYILFFWSLEISISKVHADGVGPIHWEVLGIISCHLSVPETFMSPRDEVLVKNALHRLTFLNTWPQPVSLLVKVVKSLGGGASLEELDYGKQTLRFYSLVSVLVFFLLSSPSNVKVQRPEWSTSHPAFTIIINHISSNFQPK